MRPAARKALILALLGFAGGNLLASSINFGPVAKLTPDFDPSGSSDPETEIAISGGVIAAATFLGNMYVYVKPAGGWTDMKAASAFPQPAATDLSADGELTGSVAISGDIIVAGASVADIGANSGQGMAYVFVRPPGGWSGTPTESARLVASDGRAFEQLGGSVAVDGDTVVVAAQFRGNHTPAGLVGGAYVFRRPVGGWSGVIHESAILLASDGKDGDLFGNVAVSGSTVAVGVPLVSVGPGLDDYGKGKVYVFEAPKSGWSGTLQEEAILTASDGQAGNGGSVSGDALGYSIAIDGDTVVSGTFSAMVAGRVGAGAVYVFTKPAGGWISATEDAKLTSTVQTNSGGPHPVGEELGISVGLSGGLIAAGAPAWTPPPPAVCCSGAIYAFSKGPGGWADSHENQIALTPGSDSIGTSISLDGGTMIALEPTGIEVFGPSSFRIPSPARGLTPPKPARSAGR